MGKARWWCEEARPRLEVLRPLESFARPELGTQIWHGTEGTQRSSRFVICVGRGRMLDSLFGADDKELKVCRCPRWR